MKQKRVYLDYAATTPVDARVRRAMEPYFSDVFGNPSSIHAEGNEAKKAVDEARTKVARVLEGHAEEIIFTSGGTEANNLAIFGVINSFSPSAPFLRGSTPKSASGRTRGEGVASLRINHPLASPQTARHSPLARGRGEGEIPHLITTNIEHSSVLEPLRALERQGRTEVSFVPVEPNGIVRPEKIVAALRPNTVLVSVQYANNEIGTIQPILKIGKLLAQARKAKSGYPFFHIDACQAPLYLHCLVNALGADLLTLDAHKIYGPKGVGCLYMRRGLPAGRQGTPLAPLIFGGGQEGGLRSTTENVPGIVGFAEALTIAHKEREKESLCVQKLRDYLYSLIPANKKISPPCVVNGSMEHAERLPNNLNISLPGVDTEMLTLQLDAAGIAVSTKSSCLKDEKESYVVAALGVDASYAKSTLRFSLGRATTKKDIDYTVQTLARFLEIKQ